MNIPKIIVKEKNNKFVCTLMCILVPVMMGVLIYEIVILISKCKGSHEGYEKCLGMSCDNEETSDVM